MAKKSIKGKGSFTALSSWLYPKETVSWKVSQTDKFSSSWQMLMIQIPLCLHSGLKMQKWIQLHLWNLPRFSCTRHKTSASTCRTIRKSSSWKLIQLIIFVVVDKRSNLTASRVSCMKDSNFFPVVHCTRGVVIFSTKYILLYSYISTTLSILSVNNKFDIKIWCASLRRKEERETLRRPPPQQSV